jgi:YVTN family beta-propeller protein
LEVVAEGQALVLGPHQQRAVLALLVLSAGEVVSSDRLIEALWGERPPASAAKTVQVYISRLRKTLNGAQASDGLIVTADRGYMLRVDPGQVDVRAFERLLDRGRDAFGDHEFDGAATVLRHALGLWRGPPFADFTFDAFAAAEIARLQELRLEALEIRIDADLALGRHAALVAELEALTAEHPLRERLRAARMLALCRCGREPEALELYRETRRMLVDELGMEPSPALRELHDAILRQDPALAPPAAARPPPAAGSDARVRRRRRAGLAAATLALAGGVALVIALLPKGDAAPIHVEANSVAVIDPSSRRLLAHVGVGGRPGPLAQAAGSVWVANLDDNTITGIGARSRRPVGTSTVGRPISDMTAAGNSLWISEAGAGVAQWDATVNGVAKWTSVSVYDHPGFLQSAGTPQPLAVDASSLWMGQDGAVTRLDATGTRRPVLIKGVDSVNAIAVGAGATWVSDTGNDVVSKIVGDSVVGNPIPTGAGPGAIAVADGSVWVAERYANKVARIDPSADRVTTEIPVGEAPRALAVIGHSVWVANSGDGTLSEIDTRTNRVVHTLRIGNSPAALAVIGGRLWVSVEAPAANVAAATGGVARVAFKDDPGSLDPALAFTYANPQIPNATCANLYNYSDASGAAASRIIPEVARTMPSVSEDGSRYTITIRRGFGFSPPSREPVTAETFRHVIERTLSPRWHASVMDFRDVPDIVGLRAYQSGHARHISGVSASGDRLIIRLAHRDPVLAQRLAMPVFCAVPDNAAVREADRLPMAGPYYVSAYNKGKQIVLRAIPTTAASAPPT